MTTCTMYEQFRQASDNTICVSTVVAYDTVYLEANVLSVESISTQKVVFFLVTNVHCNSFLQKAAYYEISGCKGLSRSF